jgi:tetratricopeptide (TPR) repeat protein
VVAVVAVLVGGCGDKADPAAAQREVDAGLKAHVAGKYGSAEEHYRAAIKKDKKNKLAYYNLGLIEQTLGHADEAETAYRVTLKLDPDYGPALFNLAILRTKASSYGEAAELYRRAIAVKPTDATAHLNLGLLLRDHLGQSGEGQTEIAKALELDPGLAARTSTSAPQDAPSG